MNPRPLIRCILLSCIALALPGCMSSSEVKTSNPTSVGQQLTDLDRARQQGIITEKEYEKLKKAIIRNND